MKLSYVCVRGLEIKWKFKLYRVQVREGGSRYDEHELGFADLHLVFCYTDTYTGQNHTRADGRAKNMNLASGKKAIIFT